MNPVLSDNNENLVHKLSHHNIEKLHQIFSGTDAGISQEDLDQKRYPIFFNFDGKSPIDMALDASDFDSFHLLLNKTIDI